MSSNEVIFGSKNALRASFFQLYSTVAIPSARRSDFKIVSSLMSEHSIICMWSTGAVEGRRSVELDRISLLPS